MIKNNPHKIKKAEIVIGIPSYNERKTISYVVVQIDKGLVKYFSNKSAVIINSDNNSPDKTREVFLKTKTKVPKIYISTPVGVKGKGNNLKNLFLEIKNLGAKAGATVDADLKSITPEWIKCLISPILKGYDYLTPIYKRSKYGATITNHLCYPLVYGLLGYDIRQPIGGDMAFSRKMVLYWLKQKWPEAVRNYGIDIFMTLNAIKSGCKIGQIDLGAKVHNPSLPKLNRMFLEVGEALFDFLIKNKKLWKKSAKIKKSPLICCVESNIRSQKIKFNFKKLDKKHKIDSWLWPQIVYHSLFLYEKNKNKEEIIKNLRTLYFRRVFSFAEEVRNKSDKEAEKIIQDQAKNFFLTSFS